MNSNSFGTADWKDYNMATNTPTAYTEFKGTVLRETDKAWQFEFVDTTELEHTIWVAKSVATAINIDTKATGNDVLSIPDWLLERSGVEL